MNWLLWIELHTSNCIYFWQMLSVQMVFILQSCWDSDVGKKRGITCGNLWSVTDYFTKNKAARMDSNVTCHLFLGLFVTNTDTQSNFTLWGSYLFMSVLYFLGRLSNKSWLDFRVIFQFLAWRTRWFLTQNHLGSRLGKRHVLSVDWMNHLSWLQPIRLALAEHYH